MSLLVICITTALINIFLGVIVYVRSPKNRINIYFALLTASIAGWIITLLLYYIITDHDPLLFIGRLNFAVSVPMTFLFYRFVSVFPKETVRTPKIILTVAFVLTVIVILLSLFTPFIDKDEIAKGVERIVVYGDLYFIWPIVFFGNLILGLTILIIKIKKAKGFVRVQLLYLLVGFLLFISIGGTMNVVLPYFNNYSLQPFGPLTTVIFVGFTTYSIVKHRLYNIRLLIVRSIAYGIVLAGVALGYAFFIIWIGASFFELKTTLEQDIIYMSLVLFVAVTFQPLKEFIKRITDKFFYKNEYKSNFLLSELNNILVQTLEIEKLMEHVLLELIGGVHLTKGAIYIFEGERIYKKQLNGYGDKTQLTAEELLILAKPRRTIVLQEEENPELRALLERNETEIVLPLFTVNKFQGLILLGEKKSGEIFTEEDIQFFEIFAPIFAVSIENSKAYEEIKDFNKTLQIQIEKATAELTKANEHLKKADKIKDEFVSLASHELRTPMTAIEGFVDMIREGRYGKVAKELDEPLSYVAESTDRLIMLVNDMLNISRIEAGRIEFELEDIPLRPLIEDVVSSLGPVAADKKIVLEAKNIPDIVVMSDSNKVKQVLNNLIGNALKFTEKGAITITAKNDGERANVYVTDTGVGIEKSDTKKLFGKFEQINTQQRGKPTGTGLGLYFSKILLKKMGGDVWLESSTLKVGSVFAFSLPCAGGKIAAETKHLLEKDGKENGDKKKINE